MTEDLKTLDDVMKAAYQALLKGDYEERDRLCGIAQLAFTGGQDFLPGDTPITDTTGATKQ